MRTSARTGEGVDAFRNGCSESVGEPRSRHDRRGRLRARRDRARRAPRSDRVDGDDRDAGDDREPRAGRGDAAAGDPPPAAKGVYRLVPRRSVARQRRLFHWGYGAGGGAAFAALPESVRHAARRGPGLRADRLARLRALLWLRRSGSSQAKRPRLVERARVRRRSSALRLRSLRDASTTAGMSAGSPPDAGRAAGPIGELAELRSEANRRFFEGEAERIARCCHEIADPLRRAAAGCSRSARRRPRARMRDTSRSSSSIR